MTSPEPDNETNDAGAEPNTACGDSGNHVDPVHQADLDLRLRMFLDGPGG